MISFSQKNTCLKQRKDVSVMVTARTHSGGTLFNFLQIVSRKAIFREVLNFSEDPSLNFSEDRFARNNL